MIGMIVCFTASPHRHSVRLSINSCSRHLNTPDSCTLRTSSAPMEVCQRNLQPVVKVQMQRWGNCNFRFWPSVGGCGPLIDGSGPLCPCGWSQPQDCDIGTLTSSSNQAFTFTSSTSILSRKNGETVQKFNAQHTEMRLLAYRSVPFSVPCVFWKFEVRERL